MIPPEFADPTNPYGVGISVTLRTGERGTLLPLLGDAHVHLGLIEPEKLPAGGIGRVVDLGWSLASAQQWGAGSIPGLEVDYVGNFVTAPGGYPSDRSWAPADATVFVTDPEAAVKKQHSAGASALKITLNSSAGPVLSDNELQALVWASLNNGLMPVIHAEGEGQAERAIRSGLVYLAHTPFSEVLSDELIAYAARNNRGWMSTLDIHGYGNYGHDFEIACDNLTRFAASGGTVLYGTDLGNGPLPVGINTREIAALMKCGLDYDRIVDSMSTWWTPLVLEIPGEPDTRASFISDISDNTCADFSTWLASARIVETTEVEY